MIISPLRSKKSDVDFNGLPHGLAPPILQPGPVPSHCKKRRDPQRISPPNLHVCSYVSAGIIWIGQSVSVPLSSLTRRIVALHAQPAM